uniref:Uncharacterized protein n=1 Tax=Rhinolophus ferrumequinum TaxID=59479 RepID=A0A671EBD0_RHIFE
ISKTSMRTRAVPVRGGAPPSTAMRVNLSSGCSSLSRALSRTSSGYFLPSLPFRVRTWKWEFGEMM